MATIEDGGPMTDLEAIPAGTAVPEAAADGTGGGSTSRQAQLTAAVARLRKRGQSITLDRWLFIGGSVLLPLGLLLVVLGWFGASHTGRLFEQIPYLISGGLLGLSLVVVGGFLYFGWWLTQLVYESRRQTDELAGSLKRMEELLVAGGAAGVAPDLVADGAAPARRSAPNGMLVATSTGSMLHRPDCPVVANRDGLKRVRADAKGY